MENIIVLSSDEDDVVSTSNTKSETNIFQTSLSYKIEDEVDDFDYGIAMPYDRFSPEVEDDVLLMPGSTSGMNNAGSNQSPLVKGKPLKNKGRVVHDLSDSDPDSSEDTYCQNSKLQSSDDELPNINIDFEPRNGTSRKTNKVFLNLETNEDTKRSPQGKLVKGQKREEQRMRKQLELEEKARLREAAKEERERKKREAAHSKALKQASAEVEKSKKKGECQKWVSTILDPGVLHADFSGEMLTALRTAELEYKVEECIIPNSIVWERKVQSVQLDHAMAVQKVTTTKREQFVLIVWVWSEVIEKISGNTLISTLEEMVSLLPGNELTIAIYGLEDYFRFQKTQKRRDVRTDVLGTCPPKRKTKEATFDSAPQVSRGDVEFALAELQVKLSVCHRCINSKTDLANLVCQFTKAIAEAPLRREQNQKDDRFDWYASGDSKDCVALDKDGNGAFQLWQRQLCQFPLASRETSEAISSLYPSPLSLMKAYDRCSNEDEAQLLLQDIPVRRGPGPLSTMRRIGPQLSKKIYTFFTTVDECCLIAPD